MTRNAFFFVSFAILAASGCGSSTTGTPEAPEIDVQTPEDLAKQPELTSADVAPELDLLQETATDIVDDEISDLVDIEDTFEIDICVPDCEGVECGDDGCGNACGECPDWATCTAGLCLCIPDCENKECGDDGCNGSCGTCEEAHKCVEGMCKWDQCDDGNDVPWDGCNDGQLSELQVNTTTVGDQTAPSLAMLSNDHFVGVWEGAGQDGEDSGIAARLFDSQGLPLGSEIPVNQVTSLGQFDPAVTASKDGFAVVWASDTDPEAAPEYDVVLRLFDVDGSPSSDDIPVNQYTAADQWLPLPVAYPDGRLLVIWASENQDGAASGIMARWFDQDGVPTGAEIGLNSYWFSSQQSPAGVALAGGGVAACWSSFQQDGDLMGIFTRVFDQDFSPLEEEFQANQYLVDDQHFAHLLALPDGGFMTSWSSWGQDGSKFGVYARAFSAAGQPAGDEFLLNATTYSSQDHPALAQLDEGRLVAVWQGNIQDGEEWGIFARFLEADFTVPEPEFGINIHTAKDQQYPVVASFVDGNFVVAWESFQQDGDGRGIFAALFDKAGNRLSATP